MVTHTPNDIATEFAGRNEAIVLSRVHIQWVHKQINFSDAKGIKFLVLIHTT